jgi:predicted nucleic acid-binding protein
MSYWDTSALAKLYLVEPDSATFDALAQRPVPIRISPLVRYEARLTFLRREREGVIADHAAVVLSRRLDQDVADGKVEVIAAGFAIESEFEQVVQACMNRATPISIRTLDALHVAAALSVGESEFLSNDVRQRAAAVAVGMTVLP